MIDFTFLTPAKIIFGQNKIEDLPKEITFLGNKAMIITGRTALRKSGFLEKIEEYLRKKSIDYILFEKVEPEPSVETIDEGIVIGRKESINCVVGIGGGSALDVAKAIAGMIPQEINSVREHVGKSLVNKGLPFIAIPTTAGTGSEVTKNSVIIDRKRDVKESILRDSSLIANTIIVDPLLTISMPPKITASSGMDALTQAIECYVSKTTNIFSNLLALNSIHIIGKNLELAYKDGKNIAIREQMAFGSLLSALAFSNGGLGAVHGLAHPIGYLYKISHGIICALLLPHVMKFNKSVKPEEFAKIGETLNPTLKNSSKELKIDGGISFIRDLLLKLNLPTTLSELGVEMNKIDDIIDRTGGSSIEKNPRGINKQLLKDLLLNAL
ncbi:MAG: iron-containing alcohol dehydrogenase [Candidatus Lokiarchaeota archaeon]|nr:iron-containing alcohol dehydrogenase [Candidatus Lokiarchaeota archaeon]